MGLLDRFRAPREPEGADAVIREVTGGATGLWHGDLEADVCEGNDVYVEVLGEWAALSRGTFAPERIEEDWSGDDVRISFDLAGTRHTITAKEDDDWLDVMIVEQLDPLLPSGGPRFHLWDVGDQSIGVCVVTDAEADVLRERLGGRFV